MSGYRSYGRWDDEDEFDSYDYRSYTRPKKKKNNYGDYRGASGWNSWAGWSNYSSFNDSDPEDSKLVVEAPEGYITPSKKEMVWKNVVVKHVEAGGNRSYGYSDYSQYAHSGYEIQEDSSKFIKNMSRFFYHDMMENEEIWGKVPEENEERGKYQQIIDKVRDIRLPFTSPLEKAVFFHNKIFKEKPSNQTFQDVIMSDQLNTVLDQMNIDEKGLNDKELNETLDDVIKPGGLLGGDPVNNTWPGGQRINPHNIDKYNLLDKISLIKSWGESFKISKEIKKEVIYNSDRKEHMLMTSIEQIIHMDLYNILFPNFKYKLATNNLHVNLPIKQEERKQKIIILIDDSGSMCVQEKIEWVLALLADRLKECKKGEAEMFVSKFEHDIGQDRFFFHHIHDTETYDKFLKDFTYYPSGGDTRIGDFINYIHNEITVKKKLHNLDLDLSEEKVEILVINDGQFGLGV